MRTAFTGYQKFVVAVLAFLQFTIILDFMILSPLGALLMPALGVSTAQFGLVVSAYAFSAGASGLLASGFADRFDRKRLLMFFYSGFLLGTLACGLAPTYNTLLAARMLTGAFGGVIGSIVFAITTDLFAMEMRGRVMGVVQSAFAGSQVLGLPIGLYLANHWGWHAPFLMIVVVGAAVGVVIALKLQPVDGHLQYKTDRNPLKHMGKTLSNPTYLFSFLTMALLSTGGFMLMPFSSAFTVNNIGVPMEDLPWIYMVTGFSAIFSGPLMGRLSDSIGKYKVFVLGSVLSGSMVLVYCNLGHVPIALLITVNVILFAGISARMISASALISGIPAPADRGSFMSISASMQQIAGGMSAGVAGLIVSRAADGRLLHFDRIGYAVAGAMVVMVWMMTVVERKARARARVAATSDG